MAGKLAPGKINSGVVPTPGQAPGQAAQPAPQNMPRMFGGQSGGGLGGFGKMMAMKYSQPSAPAIAPDAPIASMIETPQIDNPAFKYMPVRGQVNEPSLASIEPAAAKDIKWSGNYDLTPMDKIKSAITRKGLFGGTMGGAGRAMGKFGKMNKK